MSFDPVTMLIGSVVLGGAGQIMGGIRLHAGIGMASAAAGDPRERQIPKLMS